MVFLDGISLMFIVNFMSISINLALHTRVNYFILHRFQTNDMDFAKIWAGYCFLLVTSSTQLRAVLDIVHSQSPSDGILKNNWCNIPFQTKHISSELLKLPWQSPLLANTRKY